MTEIGNNFVRCMTWLLSPKAEGGFAKLKGDEVTNMGVRKSTMEAFLGRQLTEEDVKKWTVADVMPVYRLEYWNKIRGDELYYPACLLIFDFAVHSGVKQASKSLQNVLGITADGAIGKLTLASLNAFDKKAFVEAYCDERLRFMATTRLWNDYKKGWTNRVEHLRKIALQST